jgi:hypothetical protein
MIEGRTEIKRAFIAGTTRHVQFQIVNKATGEGFEPDTLTLSIYDVVEATGAWVTSPWPYVVTPPRGNDPTVTSEIVNGQNDADVSAFVDSSGNVDLYLTPEDTDIEVPDRVSAKRYQRVLLFTWTWDGSPVKVAKHEIVLSIAPDRETVAS